MNKKFTTWWRDAAEFAEHIDCNIECPNELWEYGYQKGWDLPDPFPEIFQTFDDCMFEQIWAMNEGLA